jgi:hypothetical protein
MACNHQLRQLWSGPFQRRLIHRSIVVISCAQQPQLPASTGMLFHLPARIQTAPVFDLALGSIGVLFADPTAVHRTTEGNALQVLHLPRPIREFFSSRPLFEFITLATLLFSF